MFLHANISVMTPKLRGPESGLAITTDCESWIATLPFLLMFPAQCIGAIVAERFGRRRVVTYALLPPAITCILVATAQAPSALLTASAVLGLVGGGTGIGPVLIAEITSPKYRGVLLTAKNFAIVAGFFTAHLMGKFCDWRRVVLLALAPCGLGLVTSLTSPESPAWLAKRGRFKECASAFQWLRGEEDAEELLALVHAQRVASRKYTLQATLGTLRRTARYLTEKSFLKATYISLAAVLTIESIEVYVIYTIDILTDVTYDKEIVHYLAAGLDIQGLFCLVLSGWLIKRFRRRSLLFGSGVPASCFLLLFCLASFLMARTILSRDYAWVKLVFLWLYYLVRDLGLHPVSYNILAEIYPLSHRVLGTAFVGFIYSAVAFFGIKMFPTLMARYGLHGALLLLATVMMLGMSYLYFYLPETGNKTLGDIELEMKGEKVDASALKCLHDEVAEFGERE